MHITNAFIIRALSVDGEVPLQCYILRMLTLFSFFFFFLLLMYVAEQGNLFQMRLIHRIFDAETRTTQSEHGVPESRVEPIIVVMTSNCSSSSSID